MQDVMEKQPILVKSLGTYTEEMISIYAETTSEDVLPASRAAMRHSFTQPLSQQFIERTLQGLGVKYSRDQDGDLCTVLPRETIGCALTVWFLIDGHIFYIFGALDTRIPARNWPSALLAANQYPAKCRFGRCSLAIQEGENDAKLIFDGHSDLEYDVTTQFLSLFIESHVASFCAFLHMAHREKLLELSPQPKPLGRRRAAAG